MTIQELYGAYTEHLQKIADYNGAIALLHWDSEVNAPPKGAKHRAGQIATLSASAHELSTSAWFGDILQQLSAQSDKLNAQQARNIYLSVKDYERATKLPTDFVSRFAKARANAYQAWMSARKANDYQLYKAALGEIISLSREKAALFGYEAHPYDALLDEYEEGMTVAQLEPVFARIKTELAQYAKDLQALNQATPNEFLFKHYAKQSQWDFGVSMLKQIGYDMEAGRQDFAEHPFCTSFSPFDVRVTTRINENDLTGMLGNCIHEGGHALYEQGLPAELYGQPLSQAVSLGIHESQSRLWENHVALGRPFWVANYDKLVSVFPEQLKGIDLETYYKAINQVKPNLIRVEADELHYHLHVLIRYEIEKGLIDGSITVDNLDKVWNEQYQTYLGVQVPDDKRGVLQDVHWCEGLLGYFPTYSLGSFYSAQFYATAKKHTPNLEAEIAKGNHKPLLDWLRANIHQHGRFYTPNELCKQATGEYLNIDYFMEYVREKFGQVYEPVLAQA